ncbi:MAG: exosome complex component RRP41 [Candidatus Woesearchaeota archaeon]|jgi:exosome complex component RRP41
MAYKKRFDGRGMKDLRPMSAKAGVIKEADGSAMFTIGKTTAYAAVYGPRELHPKFMQNPKTGILRVSYNMMPFSGMGDRVRPGQNRRSKELSMVIQKSLLPVLDLKEFPNSVVDVFVELTETDAGSRCASICAAAMALADAGIQMKDMISAISVGRVDDKLVLDMDYQEEAYEDGPVADIPIAVIPSTGEITLLQMDGKFDPAWMKDALELAIEGCKAIRDVQVQALKDKYKEVKE